MSQTINWLDEDVEIYDYDGNVSYLISSRDDSSHFLNPESKFYLRSTQAKPGLMIDTVSDILWTLLNPHQLTSRRVSFQLRPPMNYISQTI